MSKEVATIEVIEGITCILSYHGTKVKVCGIHPYGDHTAIIRIMPLDGGIRLTGFPDPKYETVKVRIGTQEGDLGNTWENTTVVEFEK